MKRNRYGINCQSLQLADFFELVPLHYLEVVPGDTVQGTVQARLFSDTTKAPLMNRAYFDLFAFYVPYRLLWEEFPEFIAKGADDNTLVPPRVFDTWRPNFEPGFIFPDGGEGPYNVGWLRYAYNKIFNDFFRPSQNPERALNQGTSFGITSMRRSTFMESTLEENQNVETPLNATTIEGLRQEFAEDRFRKTRQFYGDKYTDYLAALGVEASWSMMNRNSSPRSTRISNTGSQMPRQISAMPLILMVLLLVSLPVTMTVLLLLM